MFPLCLTKSFADVSWVTTYCTCAMFSVVGIIICRCVAISINSPPAPESTPGVGTSAANVVLALPILGCVMFGHMNVGQIYGELLPSVKPKANLVALTSCSLVIVLYLGIGIAGYMAFGSEAWPDIVAQLANHDHGGVTMSACQVLLASFIVLKTPLLLIPLRGISIDLLSSLASNDHSIPE